MKRFFKVIALFMIVILCAGSVSLLFDSDSSDKPSGTGTSVNNPSSPSVPDEPKEPSCTHVDADDNELCDKCGEAFSDGTDVEEPEESENTYDKDSRPVRLPSY